MKRQTTKWIALLTVCTMLTGLLTGCGTVEPDKTDTNAEQSSEQNTASEGAKSNAEEPNAEAESQTPEETTGIVYPLEGAGTLTWGMQRNANWSERHDSWADTHFVQELQKNTGITITMEHVDNADGMKLLLAGGKYPDLITFNLNVYYSGKEPKAIADNIVYGMEPEFLQENAPDYWAYLEENPSIKKAITTPEGLITCFAMVRGDEILKSSYTMFIRDDWCEQLELPIPETADEYYETLKAFKEELNVEIPLCVTANALINLLDYGILTSPFGIASRGAYVEDGKVKLGYAQEGYKDVLAWLNKLYEEKLLDPNFTTIEQNIVDSNILTGVSGVSSGSIGSKMGVLLKTNAEQDFSLAAVPSLVANKGDTAMFAHYDNGLPGTNTYITTDCKDPAAAAHFLNYGYTQEGHMLYNFGTEGLSYEMVDGIPTYTDLIMKNEEGLSVSQAMSEYELAWWGGPFVQDRNYILQYYEWEAQREALDTITKTDVAKYKLPNTLISEENQDEYANISSEINTYRAEMELKFIRGEESLDNFDQYLENLKNMNIDRLIEIEQEALDEFNSR